MLEFFKAHKYLRRGFWLFLIISYFVVTIFVMDSLGVGCVFRDLCGFPCPGCGMTSAFLSLLQLDFSAALRYNPLVFCMPYLIIYLFFDLKNKRLHNFLLATIGILAVINWLLRLFGILSI
ncbi:MAG: DUF2752 domain-containing protein [Clostridia bacterium]|nr:DUF2752 domain-containing protein [Clostridia bacterium]